MILARILSVAMMILAAGASIAYLADGDWRRALYWAAASVLTFAVTV